MNLRFLETFVWVARLNSFKLAADKLYATPASVSNRVATLEEELGVRLLDRKTGSVTLTAKGAELLPLAENMLGLQTRMRHVLGQPQQLTGVLRLGVIETVVLTWLPELLSRFAAACPQVKVEVHSDFSAQLRDELLRGALDVVLTAEELTPGYVDNHRIATYDVVWVASPSVAASLPSGPLAFADLLRFPVLSFHRGSTFYRIVVHGLAAADAEARAVTTAENEAAGPEPVMHTFSSLAVMMELACSGFGVSPLPRRVAQKRLASGELIELPVKPAPEPLPLWLSLRNQPESELAQVLLQQLHSMKHVVGGSGWDEAAGR